MSSRDDAERAERRRRALFLLGGSLLLAAIVVAALVLVSESDDSGGSGGDIALLEGVPESGIGLGDPAAPVTVVEFADPQCPYCAEFSREVLPELVRRYVKPGKVRIELRLLDFIGPDSTRLARAAYAASLQGGMWRFAHLAYARQGPENSGYADDGFVESVAGDAGLDVDQLVADAESDEVGALLEQARREADDAGIDSTPSFLIGRTGEELQPFEGDTGDLSAFAEAIEETLKSAR